MYREQYGEYAYLCWGVEGQQLSLYAELNSVHHIFSAKKF